MSLRHRYQEWKLRNDTTYDDLILVDNDGYGWLTWIRNDHTEEILRPLGQTKVYEGHTYAAVIQMWSIMGAYGMSEAHSKTKERAVRLGRRICKEHAIIESTKRDASRPESKKSIRVWKSYEGITSPSPRQKDGRYDSGSR